MISPEPKPRVETGRAKALYDFQGQSAKELSFSKVSENIDHSYKYCIHAKICSIDSMKPFNNMIVDACKYFCCVVLKDVIIRKTKWLIRYKSYVYA